MDLIKNNYEVLHKPVEFMPTCVHVVIKAKKDTYQILRNLLWHYWLFTQVVVNNIIHLFKNANPMYAGQRWESNLHPWSKIRSIFMFLDIWNQLYASSVSLWHRCGKHTLRSHRNNKNIPPASTLEPTLLITLQMLKYNHAVFNMFQHKGPLFTFHSKRYTLKVQKFSP